MLTDVVEKIRNFGSHNLLKSRRGLVKKLFTD